MKKLYLFIISLIFLCPVVYSQEEFPNYGLGGWITSIRSDMLDDKHSPDLLNIDTDKYTGLITRRLGSVYFNSTALEGSKWIRNAYVYRQIDNDEYIIVISSKSAFYTTGNGSFTKIRSNLNSTSIPQFTTGKNIAYIVDGTTWPWKWNGTTATILDNKKHSGVTISTGMPAYPYFVAWWHNRLWFLRTDSEPSTAWYSNYNDPENIGTNNYKYINVSDGDYITGVFLYQNRLIITKRYSTWEIVEIIDDNSDPFFQIKNISEKIGCLYQNTMREHLGNPMWMSNRGVELYNGNFNLVSEPIDDYIKSLNQLTADTSLTLSQDSAADWGAGSGTNIDTTTYSGSVAISNSQQEYNESGSYGATIDLFSYKVRQSFRINTNRLYDTVKLYFTGISPSAPNNRIDVHILNSNFSVLASSKGIVVGSWGGIDFTYRTVKLNTYFNILQNSTYYILITSNTLSSGKIYLNDDVGNSYINGSAQTSTYSGNWTNYANDIVFYLTASTNIASNYTSQTLNAGSTWGSWGSFSVDETKPSGSNIIYYARAGGVTPVPATQPLVQLINGAPISLSTGPYIALRPSFTRTDALVIPKLNSINIGYNTTSASKQPYAIDYEDKYYIAFSTLSDIANNNVVGVYQRNGEWTRYNGTGMNWGSAFVYKNNLYSCDSKDTGRIYRHNVSGRYDDNNSAYESYWTSKIFNFGSIRESTMLDLCPLFNNAGDWNVNIQYRMHGSDSSWTTISLNLYDSTFGLITQVIPLSFPKSYFFQYRIQEDDIDESFEYRGMTIRYMIEELK